MQSIIYNNSKIEYVIIKSKIKNIYIKIKDGQVIITSPIKVKNEEIEKIVLKKAKWIYENLLKYKKEDISKKIDVSKINLELFGKKVENIIKKYSLSTGLYPNKVKIKNIKYAWGSCSNKKNISINLKLANKSDEILEYVILHEICHLKYMNHSKEFWELVEKHMKDYKERRKELRD